MIKMGEPEEVGRSRRLGARGVRYGCSVATVRLRAGSSLVSDEVHRQPHGLGQSLQIGRLRDLDGAKGS